MKTRFIIIKLLTLVLLAFVPALGCGDDAPVDEGLTAADAQARAESLTGGTAEAAVLETENGRELWVMMVGMSNGASLKVEIFKSDGQLLEIFDDAGPFDYQLAPLEGALSYSEALSKAQEYQAGELEAWEVKLGSDGAYFYEFYLRDVDTLLWEIKITPVEGELISKEEKLAVD